MTCLLLYVGLPQQFNDLLGPLEAALKAKEEAYKRFAPKKPDPNAPAAAAAAPAAAAAAAGEAPDRKLMSVALTDLQTKCVLGKGSFGTVTLVKHTKTGDTYAFGPSSRLL